jgi:hypothetical protein
LLSVCRTTNLWKRNRGGVIGNCISVHVQNIRGCSENRWFLLQYQTASDVRSTLQPSIQQPYGVRLRLKCDGTRAETGFRLSAKRTSPFKSAGASVQSTTGSRGVRISGSNAGYTMFRGSVKGTGYPLR